MLWYPAFNSTLLIAVRTQQMHTRSNKQTGLKSSWSQTIASQTVLFLHHSVRNIRQQNRIFHISAAGVSSAHLTHLTAQDDCWFIWTPTHVLVIRLPKTCETARSLGPYCSISIRQSWLGSCQCQTGVREACQPSLSTTAATYIVSNILTNVFHTYSEC